MKYTILNNTKKDISDGIKKTIEFFKTNGWDISFEVKDTDYPLPSATANGTDNGETQWVIKPNIPYTGKTIFIFNPVNVTGGYITSTTINKDFITVVYNGNLWKSLTHEIMHSLFKTYAPMLDCMDFGQFMIDGKLQPKSYYKNDDPYAVDGNYAEAFKRLVPYKMTYKYFKPNEIVGLKPELVALLDKARDISGVPFSISSGLRTASQNTSAGGVENSAHLLGKAVDIHCPSSVNRLKMVSALLQVGFKRLGIGKDFIHADIGNSSDNLPENVMWTYYK